MTQPGQNPPQQHPVVDSTGQMIYSSPPNTGPPQQHPVVGNTGQIAYNSPPYPGPPQQHPVVGNTGHMAYSSQHPVVGNTGQMTYSSPPQQHPVMGNTGQMTYSSLPYTGPPQQHPVVANTGQMAYPSYTNPSHSSTLTSSVIPSQPQVQALPPPFTSASTQHHLAYQQEQEIFQSQQKLQHQEDLQVFWEKQMQEIKQTTDFKNHSLPLARIKKIMKADEDVRMISAEAPVVFAKACELFIFELTMRSWLHTEENKRRTLQKSDIGASILKTEIFDFLLDVIPTEELKEEEGLGGGASSSGVIPMENHHFPHPINPYYYHQMGSSSGMTMGQPVDQSAMYMMGGHQQPIINNNNNNPVLPPPEAFMPWPHDQQQELHEQSDS